MKKRLSATVYVTAAFVDVPATIVGSVVFIMGSADPKQSVGSPAVVLTVLNESAS